MHKERQPLSTKKPPIPEPDYKVIEDWMANGEMPITEPMH